MKIAFILPGGGRSGGVRSTVRAANGLLKKGHDVRLFVHSHVSLKSHLRNLWLRFQYARGSDWLDLFKGDIIRFRDVVECDFGENETVVASGWWAAGKLRSVKHSGIIKVHQIRGVAFDDKAKMEAAWGEVVPKLGIAAYLNEVMEKTCGQRLRAVTPNGVDAQEYYPSGSDNPRDGIGTIYGPGYHKDPDTLLSVLKTLGEQYPEVPQRVFGAGLRPKAIPRNIYHRLPTLEAMREMYSRSLVWIMASRSEGFSNPILEAMACGCAVVATDCGGPKDMIQDGSNGFLCGVGNVAQIVEKVGALLEDSDLRNQLVLNSQKTVQAFSWDNSIDKLEKTLLNIYGDSAK